MNPISVVAALLSALANAATTVLQRRASVEPEARNGPRGSGIRARAGRMLQPLRRPLWWGGTTAIVLSALLQVVALDTGKLSVVQPLLASELLFALLLMVFVFHNRPSGSTWVAFAMLAVGLALFLAAASPSGGGGKAGGLRWLIVGGCLIAAVVCLLLFGRSGSGAVQAAMRGSATAACFAATAALIKEVTARFSGGLVVVLTDWHLYAAAVAGLASMLLLQWTLRSGTLVASQPALTLGDALISVALGYLLFGERIALGWHLLFELLGIALMAAGVIGVTRTPAVTGEGEADQVDDAGADSGGDSGGDSDRVSESESAAETESGGSRPAPAHGSRSAG